MPEKSILESKTAAFPKENMKVYAIRKACDLGIHNPISGKVAVNAFSSRKLHSYWLQLRLHTLYATPIAGLQTEEAAAVQTIKTLLTIMHKCKKEK